MQAEILLVEDEKHFAKSLKSILTHYKYNCTIASTGNEAISLLKRKVFDIALLDVGLPDISGCTVAEFITTTCSNTMIIMLTGINSVETAVEAMKKGAFDFLNKPVDQHQLIKSIEKSLEHKLLQRQLRASEKRLRTLAEVAWEGIIIYRDDSLLEANTQFFRMFGYDDDELNCDNFLDRIITPESRQQVHSRLIHVKPVCLELKGIRKNGTIFSLQVKSCIIDYLDSPARVMIMRDVSDLLHFENEKRIMEKKLANADKLKALGMMAGSVAHDLNNILTAVVSYPDMLLRQMESTEKHYDEIKKIQQAGKLAAAVVSDLVSTVRGGVRTSIVTNLNEIITDHLNSIEHSERLVKYPQVIVTTDLQPNLLNIECSPEHISKILLNLIGNGLESIRNAGSIQISTSNHILAEDNRNPLSSLTPGKYVKLVITDSGPGINPKEIDYIFDPFYTTKVKGKSGTGLGLSIVWNVVREHKGDIEVKNVNPGASFEILLPATLKPVQDIQQEKIPASMMGDGEVILLVDDQPEQNALMQKMLTMLGYNTSTTENGEQAIAYLLDNTVDLVILDMFLGKGLNGRQTYEEILKNHPKQPAIIVSGYCNDKEFDKARSLGITQIIEKPLTLPIISKAIKQSLGQGLKDY